MRDSKAHAATSGSVPFMLRGPKSVRTTLAVAVAAAIGFAPAVMVASPAYAVPGEITRVGTTDIDVTEGGRIEIRLNRETGGPVTEQEVTWIATGGDLPAADSDDVVSMSGTVVFPAATNATSPQSQTISIQTVNDTMDEEDVENLDIAITVPGSSIPVTAHIKDNDAPPTYRLMVDDTTPDEGASSVKVSAMLSAPSGKEVRIPVSTTPGSAKAGAEQDYVALASDAVLTVPVGSYDSSVESITINNDHLYEEQTQSFTVKSSSSTTASGTQSVTVGIEDNEEQPEINVEAVDAAPEGTDLDYLVSLSGPRSERPVSATWTTADGVGSDFVPDPTDPVGRATASSDYNGGTGTVTFRAATGEDDSTEANKQQHVKIRTLRDSIDEIDPEALHLTLSKPVIGKLGDKSVATGRITDENLPPEVRLLPTTRSAAEGNSGQKAQTFTVRLDKASGRKVVVNYATDESSAKQGSDFIMSSGSLIFQPGETEKTFSVNVVGDTALELDEKFTVTLTVPTGVAELATSANGPQDFTIRNDDSTATYSVAPLSVKEGSEGTVAVLPIKLSAATDTNAAFTVTPSGTPGPGVATNTGAGLGEVDYVAPATPVIIPAGQTTGYAYFLVNGDDVYEGDESFTLTVSPTTLTETLVTGTGKTAKVTITDDDAAPSLQINDADAEEGDDVQLTAVTVGAAQNTLTYNVTLRGGSVNGSVAASANDFTDPGTVGVTIDGGTISGTTVRVGDPVTVADDEASEPAETVLITGSAFGTAGKVVPGTLTIAANDGADEVPTNPGEPGEPGESPKPTIFAPATVNGAANVTITGKVAANATVELWGAPIGGGAPAWIANTKATATGNYSFTRSIVQGMRFVTQSKEVNSNEARVLVNQWASLTATSPSKGRVSVTVKTSPNANGRKVVVQRWTGPNTWTNLLVSRANVNGAYAATTVVPSGTIALRAWVEGDAGRGINGPGWSDIVRPVIK
ncbi:Calx-beta domain-containing protein [Paractinoplanes maris]|uniref:Calx-beta domain-containing protein n=1 Tax=Paractinoplanes maris TaxID=1734446 RepID=UPI0020208F5D|nr:Calx-beta domain-containing protein [Actinoplanes maris]